MDNNKENNKENNNKQSIDDIRKMLDELDEKISQISIPEVELIEEETPNEEEPIEEPIEKSEEESTVEDIPNLEEQPSPPKESASMEDPLRPLDEKKEPKKKTHWFRNFLILLLFLAFTAYAAVSYYFYDHFYQNTVIWGQDCSFKTVDEVKDLVAKSINTYQITLHERDDKTEVLTAESLGLELLNDGTIEGLLESQECYKWITFFWKEFDYQKDVNLNLSDENLLKNLTSLQAEQEANVIAPADAYFTYSEEEKKYVIIPEVYGNTINNDILAPQLKQAILSKTESFDLEESGCYMEPEIKQDNENLVKPTTQLNAYLATNIVYDFGDRKEVIDVDVLKDWVSLNKKNEAVLDKKKVKNFVHELVEKYDTLGKDREFKSIAGNKVEVSGGTYGWKINEEKEYKKLVSLIKKHKQTTRTPIYVQEAKCRDTNDLGDTYIEIDLAQQHMWYYKDGDIEVSTPVVTGDVTKGRGTPTGVYYILYKQTDHVLRGQGYASHVDFWMPFIGDRGIGIHDASWRSSYGGRIYRGNGSHGCVNTPRSAVSEIFYNVDEDCPVVVHW